MKLTEFLKLTQQQHLVMWSLARNFYSRLSVLIIVTLKAGSSLSDPRSGWKEETNWKSGQDHQPRRGPHLLPDLPTNISVTAGRPATLPCRVANLKGRSVSWIRQEDLKVLATDNVIFTSDTRLKIRAWRTGVVWAWDLEIEDAVVEDSGVYECQVNTRPKVSHPVHLDVQLGGAVIAGPPEVYVEAGSRLLLTCWVMAPPKPPGPITWLHDLTPVKTDGMRGGVSLHIAQEGPMASARLSLTSLSPADAGNYTCQPEGLDSAQVTVFVLKDEEPRAMHHDSATSLTVRSLPALLASTVLVLILR